MNSIVTHQRGVTGNLSPRITYHHCACLVEEIFKGCELQAEPSESSESSESLL